VQVVAKARAGIAAIKAKPVVAVQQVAVAPKRAVVQRRPVIVKAKAAVVPEVVAPRRVAAAAAAVDSGGKRRRTRWWRGWALRGGADRVGSMDNAPCPSGERAGRSNT